MKLKRWREKRGLTQVALAKRAKIHPIYLAQLELGTKKNPSFAVVQRLARALRVDIADLT